MKSTKVSSFTLSELLIVLVVASIVIGMAFLVLNMVQKQVMLIQNNYQKKQIINNFEIVFQQDFNNNKAHFSPKANSLILNNTKDSIIYILSSDFISRNKDTFDLSIERSKLFLNGTEVKSNQFDGIEISFSKEFTNRKLFFFQKKDASYYVNN